MPLRRIGLVDYRTVFRGAQATRKTVLDLSAAGRLAGAQVILFSAHGLLDQANPQRSAVVLARPAGGTEADRYLYARDIAQLDVQAQTIVVSSCDSGRGRVAAGEGVLGLPQAFFAAGARSTVLTLWKIQDDALTVDLTSLFLKHMQSGHSPADALARAKRKIRNRAGEAFWAPFVLIGG